MVSILDPMTKYTMINACTNFQIFNIQIPENFFSKMTKSWICDESLHFGCFLISMYSSTLMLIQLIIKDYCISCDINWTNLPTFSHCFFIYSNLKIKAVHYSYYSTAYSCSGAIQKPQVGKKSSI